MITSTQLNNSLTFPREMSLRATSSNKFDLTFNIRLKMLVLTVIAGFCMNGQATAQLSGTKNVPGDYATLGAAIAALNTNGVAPGGVTINVVAGNAQTAPTAGGTGSTGSAIGAGYVINVTGAYAPSAANPVIIEGNNNTVTSSALSTATNYNDAIFTIAGTSYVTIKDFKMRENGSNTTITASNNVTEFGVAIVGATVSSAHVGSQYCTVENCNIQLNTSYTCNIGIYSNSNNVYSTAYTTTSAPTATTGANSYNTYYLDTVVGTTSGIVLIGNTSYNDINTVIGALSNSDTIALGNRTANMVMSTAYSGYSKTEQDGVYAIYNFNININYNQVTLGTGSTTNTVNGINVGACATGSAFTTQIAHNHVTLRTAATTQYTGITNATSSVTNATIKINNNLISCYGSGSTGIEYAIYNTGQAVVANFNNNQINDTTVYVAYGIYNTATITTMTMNGNSGNEYITANGQIYHLYNTGTITTGNFDNNSLKITDTYSGAYSQICINNGGAVSNFSMSNNNLYIVGTSVTANCFAAYNTGTIASTGTMSYDTLYVNAVGQALVNTGSMGTGTFDYNVITLAPVGTTAAYGVYNTGAITTADVSYNTISSGSTIAGTFYGVALATGTVTTATVTNNTINTVNSGTAYGIYRSVNGTTYTASNNTISLKETGTNAVTGMYYSSTTAIATTYCNNNTLDISTTAATTTAAYFIYHSPSAGNASGVKNTFNNNIFKSTYNFTNTTGSIYLLYDAYENPTDSICNNYVSGSISKTGSGGNFYGIYNYINGSAFNTTSICNNRISNITVSGSTAFWGIFSATYAGQGRTIAYDTVSSITTSTGNLTGILADYCASTTVMRYNYLNGLSGGGNVYGLNYATYNAPGTASANALGGVVDDNTINNLSSSGASSNIMGINLAATTSSVFSAYNNTITNLSASGTTAPALYGIYDVNGTTPSIYNNNINTFSTTAGGSANAKVYGMYVTGTVATTANIYLNNIYSLSTGTSGGSTTQCNGMYLPSSTSSFIYNVYNNFISSLAAPSSNNPDAIIGINLAATGATWNVYFNTLYIPSVAGSTNFGVTGVLFPSGSTLLSLKNNIINITTSGTLSGTGIAACVRRNVSGTTGTAPTTSNYDGNYNIYYTNGASQNYFYAEQTAGGAVTNGYNLTIDPNFNACAGSYKSYMGSGRESTTYTENNLTSGAYSGMYLPSSSSYAYQNGLQITSPAITADYSGGTRNNPPCMGALEFTGSYPATGAPVITFSPLNSISYCIPAPPTLNATMTSAAGINTSSGTKPRMYYRGSSDANSLGATNNSSTDGWKYVEASNGGSPFSFTPDYTLLNHTVSAGTTIYYFVVAQDLNVTPLVAAKSVGFASGYCPTGVALTSGAFPTVSAPAVNSYTVTSLPSFTASASPGNYCGTSNAAALSLSPNAADLQVQWQSNSGSGFTNISGGTTSTYNATPPTLAGTSATVSYEANLTCNGSVVATSSSASTTEYSPSVTSTTPGSRCGSGTVTLGASGPGSTTLEWFSAATGGAPLYVGTSYTTPSISSTTIYYVADSFGNYGSPQSAGPASTAIGTTGTGAYYGLYNNAGVNFTVNNPLTIQSVDIYPNATAKAFTIWIYNNVGTVIFTYSGTTTVASGAQTVTLNAYLAPGTYQMAYGSLASGLTPYFNTSGYAYPYSSNFANISLTSSPVAGYYFYFYNWKVVAGCTSARTAVTATINSLPTAGTITASPSTVCTGANLTLSETGTPTGGGTMTSYSWTGPNSFSNTATATSVGNAVFSPTTTAASGYYSLTVTYPGTGCTSSAVTTGYITVNATTTPTISGTLSACVGATSTLSASIVSGTWSSSDTTVARIDPTLGIVTGVAAGTATISYTTPCGAVGIATFTTNTTPGPISGLSDMCISSSTTMTNGVGGGSWSSTNTFVATIDATTGVVTSTASTGTTTISYAIGSCSVAASLIVSNTSPGSISGTATMCTAGTTTLSCSPAGGTWSSSSTGLASVNASTGVVTGVAPGSPTITYSTGCGTNATYGVTVNGTTISLSTNGPLCTGATASLTAALSGSGTYSWSGPNSYSSTLQNPTISSVTTSASGTYTFSATVSGCTNSSNIYLPVDVTPTVSVTVSNSTICTGGSSTLSDAVTAPTSFMVNSIPYSLATLTSPTTLNSSSTWTGGYDDGYINVSIPFSFSLYGVSYSSVNISANGYVNFGTGFSSGAYTAASLPTTSSSVPKSMIALFWHDMSLASGGTITYGTMGTAPNRKFIINYNAVPDASGLTTNTGQIVLYETTNNIDLMVANTASSSKTCGVQNSTGTSGLTANGENAATYAITSVAPQGWRFSTPSYSYTWTPSTDLSSTTVYNPISSGLASTQVYTVTTADVNSSCTGNNSTATVNVVAQPSVTVTSSASAICTGGFETLTATPSGGTGTATYTWTGPGIASTTGTTPTPGAFVPTVAVTTTAAYSVSLAYSGSGCTTANATTSPVTVATQAVVNVSPSATTLCYGDNLSLSETTASGGAGTPSYSWSGPGITTTTGTSSTSPVFTPTVSSGAYSVAVTYSGSGCTTSYGSTSAVTVNSLPTITLGATPNVCMGITSASLAYSGTTGSPTTYAITYDGTAHTAGFSDVTPASLPGGGIITLSVPGAAPAATYTGTLTVSSASCTSSNYTINVNVISYPTAAITSAAVPCSGYTTSVVFSGTTGGVLDYVSEGDTLHTTISGGMFTVTTSPLTSAKSYELIDIHDGTNTCYNSYDSIITINPTPMQWTGASDTNWNNSANWSCGFVPTSGDNVTIPSGATNAPSLITSGSGTTNNLTINSGATLTLYSSSTLNVKGTLANNSTVSGAGTLSMSGSTAQHMQGMGYVSNLDINNTAGVNVDSGARPVITGALSLSGGMLNTGDSVVLNSDSTNGTARIAPITAGGAGISGKVQVRQYIDYGHRAYRFWSHPFSDTISLAQIEKFIDITGNSGNTYGFTNTFTNAPSAFWYNPLHGNSALSYDPGWNAFNNALETSNDTDKVHPYQGFRLFIRGSKGEGLLYPASGSYVVDPATVGMSGPVNQGTKVVYLQKGTGANQDYNQIGNPYASPVDIGSIAHTAWANGQITGSAIFLWNPYMVPAGNWVMVPITAGTPYYMEAYTSFQVRAADNGDSLIFHETDKASSSSASLLRAAQGYLSLAVYDVNYQPWDMLRIQFNDQATDNEDNAWDAVRPSGPSGMNFYSWSADRKKMAMDGLPYADGKVIPLGLTSSYAQDFIMKVQGYDVPAGGQVYLHDKLLNQYTKLTDGMEYRFTITSDKATQGDNRFELRLGPVETAKVNGLDMAMTPNPATDMVNIAFTSGKPGETEIRITDVTGITVYNKSLGAQQNGSLNVSLSDLAAGIYMVELTNGDQKVVQRLVKE